LLVPGITGAVRVACGADFSMVVTSSGALYSWGWSEFGQLGHGTDGYEKHSDLAGCEKFGQQRVA
jgi:alpha-tubulin suppressor-like RCC1 family protein